MAKKHVEEPSCSNTHANKLKRRRKNYHAKNKKMKRNESVKNKRKYKSVSPVKKRAKLDEMKKKYKNMPLKEKTIYRKQYRGIQKDREQQEMNFEIINKYNSKIRDGPKHICVCCGGLWFKTQIKMYNKNLLEANYESDFINKVINEKFRTSEKCIIFCTNCYLNIKKNRIPKLALWNGLDYPTPPNYLPTPTRVEE